MVAPVYRVRMAQRRLGQLKGLVCMRVKDRRENILDLFLGGGPVILNVRGRLARVLGDNRNKRSMMKIGEEVQLARREACGIVVAWKRLL